MHYKISKRSVFSRKEAVVFAGLFIVGFLLTALFAVVWFDPHNIPAQFSGPVHTIDIVLFVLVSYVVWYQIVTEVFSWVTAFFAAHPSYTFPEKGKRVAFLTAFVPGSEPYHMLEKTIKAMKEADYPHDTWVLDEGDDMYVKKLCKQHGVQYFTRSGNPLYNMPHGPYRVKTKAGNFNSWFDMHGYKYDYVAQLDVDFVPRKDFLTKTLGYFKDPHVAFVGTPQIYGNTTDSVIARGAAEQAYNFYGPLQKGFFGQDMALFIGANHVVRVAAHERIGGYAGHIVEDHLTGMKFYADKWKSVYVPEMLAVGEGPATWDAYFSQQMRWAYGLIDILFTRSARILPKMKLNHIFNYIILQQYYFYGLSQVIGVFLLLAYFVFGIQSISIGLFELLIIYIPLVLWQQIMFFYLQRYNVDPKTEKGFLLAGRMLNIAVWPIYFLALLGVLMRKRITYKVTPKSTLQTYVVSPALFIPHFVLGSLTLVCLIWAALTDRQSPLLLFWAVVNTIAMYYFFIMSLFNYARISFKKNNKNKKDNITKSISTAYQKLQTSGV